MESQLELDFAVAETQQKPLGSVWVSGEALDKLLAMAPRSPGWAFRDKWPPQFVTINGNHGRGCQLAIIPAVHWRPQVPWKTFQRQTKIIVLPTRKRAA